MPYLCLNKIQKYLVAISCVAFVAVVLAVPETAHAVSGWETVQNWIVRFLHGILTAVPGLLLVIAGLLLNFSIDQLVVNMGGLITGDAGVGYVINLMWEVIRDIMNIGFIFSLIYIGIKTILNADDSGTRRLLGMLIMAAILVNFSLFITKAVIDVSNVAAVQIFNLIEINGGAGGGGGGYGGVSGAFMNALGVHSLSASADIIERTEGFASKISFVFVSMIFILVTAIVFAAGAFMIIARFVALIFYMIFSPLMFLGWVLPAFAGFQKRWWDGFLKYTFFAPAYMFMLLVSLYTINFYMASISPTPNLAPSLLGETAGFDVILVFFVATGMMIGSIIVANQMSIAGAGTAMNVLQAARKNTQGYIGRNTVGRGANRLAKVMDKMEPGGRWTKAYGITRDVATFGTLGTGGVRSTLEKARNADFGSGASFTGLGDEAKKEAARTATIRSAGKIKATIATGVASGATADEVIAMERSVADATTAQLEEMGTGVINNALVAGALTTSQFESIMKSDKFNDADKAKIAATRSAAIAKKLREDPSDETSRIQVEDASVAQLSALGAATLLKPENAVNLSGKQMDDLEKKLTESEFKRIEEARKTALLTVAAGGHIPDSDMTLDKLLKKKSSEIASMPKALFADNAFTKGLTAAHLKAIADKQSHEVQSEIRGVLEREIASAGPRTPVDQRRIDTISDWFTDSPAGMIFGT